MKKILSFYHQNTSDDDDDKATPFGDEMKK